MNKQKDARWISKNDTLKPIAATTAIMCWKRRIEKIILQNTMTSDGLR